MTRANCDAALVVRFWFSASVPAKSRPLNRLILKRPLYRAPLPSPLPQGEGQRRNGWRHVRGRAGSLPSPSWGGRGWGATRRNVE